MAFIGNTNLTQSFIAAIDTFNGDATTVAFTLSRPVASVAQIQVVIENVPQNPNSAFSVSGNTLTFTSAPPSGSSNIYVYYVSTNTQVYEAISEGDTGGFPSGTLMLFVQTSAPTGWTKSTTHNNKALRIVSGTASSGGTTAFTTVFTNQTPTINTSGLSAGATTLTTAQIPAHTHATGLPLPLGAGYGADATGSYSGNTGSTGGGGSHTHTVSGSATSSAVTLNVAYVDAIIAEKD